MGKITFITGGARSGKSTYAEKYAKNIGRKVTYMATAIAFDDSMKHRIAKHKEQRPESWGLIEAYKDLDQISKYKAFDDCELLLLDCMTILISNQMIYSGIDFDKCRPDEVDDLELKIKAEISNLLKYSSEKDIIIVSNEIGMGIVPPYRMGAYFRDIAGRMNQFIASISDEVYFIVSGIELKIK